MSFAIEEIQKLLEKDGIVAVPDKNPNRLFVLFNVEEDKQFAIMMDFDENANLLYLIAEIPVAISNENKENALLAASYINETLKFGSAAYLSEINRVVFKFYFNMEEEWYNLSMFDYSFYEAIALIGKYTQAIDLLEKGAIRPREIIEMTQNNMQN